jgi:hypothetical protein
MYKLLLGNRRSLLRLAFPFITVAAMCFAFLPLTPAVSPPPDGVYAGGNTAEGQNALLNLTTGDFDTAIGASSLSHDTTGGFNTAIGAASLLSDTTGSSNTAVGTSSLRLLDGGGSNTAVGFQALFNNSGSTNVALGANAGFNLTTGDNNIDIVNPGVADESNTIRLGSVQTKTFIAGIRGRTTGFANAVPVVIDSAGQLGTASSSQRFKHDIKPMDKASEAILALKPVTFHYKSDNTGTPQFGLIAEEVAKVNPDLVVRDEKGEIYTVRYDAVNAMLLNEFLKEHQTVQDLKSLTAKQEATIAKQQKDFQAAIAKVEQAVTARLNEQAAQIQKVSAQLEMSKSTPKMVLNQ